DSRRANLASLHEKGKCRSGTRLWRVSARRLTFATIPLVHKTTLSKQIEDRLPSTGRPREAVGRQPRLGRHSQRVKDGRAEVFGQHRPILDVAGDLVRGTIDCPAAN